MMVGVATRIRALIESAFQQTAQEYSEELGLASLRTKVRFANIRPVFICGNPDDVAAGDYLLFVGLNPKLDEKRLGGTGHYADLNADATQNAHQTLGYFRHVAKLHSYFLHRAKVASAFLRSSGHVVRSTDGREVLRQGALFLETVPYHSSTTPTDCFRSLEDLSNVMRAREVLHMLLNEHAPAALILDGRAAHGILPRGANAGSVKLVANTLSGQCLVEIDHFQRIPVMRCGFIRSRYGPNSNRQLAELGSLLASLR